MLKDNYVGVQMTELALSKNLEKELASGSTKSLDATDSLSGSLMVEINLPSKSQLYDVIPLSCCIC